MTSAAMSGVQGGILGIAYRLVRDFFLFYLMFVAVFLIVFLIAPIMAVDARLGTNFHARVIHFFKYLAQ